MREPIIPKPFVFIHNQFFVNVNRVNFSTISYDLVPVQPIDPPSGKFLFFNYVYGD